MFDTLPVYKASRYFALCNRVSRPRHGENQVAGTYISQQLPFADTRSYQLYEDIETATYSHL